MPENHEQRPDQALEAPPALVSALKRLPEPPLFIPPTVDEAILRAGQRHLIRKRLPSFKWLPRLPWLAATAALFLVLALIPQIQRKPARSGELSYTPEDINHDGQVDILDALALARQLKAGPVFNRQLDVNGDGVVDERDVATVAARAVSLQKGGRS